MNTAITIGIIVGTIISAVGCIAWYANGVKKRNKMHKEITDEFRMILTCLLHEHNPHIFVAIREDCFGQVTAALKAYGESYSATSSCDTKGMVEQAKKAKDFFEAKKPAPWKSDSPQNDVKKEHTMKIIVTGSPTIGPTSAQYEAPRWEVNQDGELIIFGDNDKVVGTHAPGTWAHVRGYAEES